MPNLEIIAVDPNCFYASTEDDSDVDIEGDQNGSYAPIPLRPIPSDNIQIDTDSMEIITLNIDDNLLIDSQEEDMLFLTDRDDLQHFDLASYIVGESSSSFLLSPPPALLKQRTPLKSSSARQRLISMSDFTNAIHKKSVNESSPKQAAVPVQNTPATHVQKMPVTPANNQRKRKILAREFIYTSSSSDDDDEHQISNKSKIGVKAVNNFPIVNNNSKKRNNENDPMWTPSTGADTKLKCKKLTKQTSVTSPIDVKLNNMVESKKSAKNMTQTQGGGGLRQLLKHQLMSSRPMKSKILKTNQPAGASNVDKTKIQKPPPKVTGLGRGKDISITAKYYNRSESSDNCDRDINHTVRNLVKTISESDGTDDDDMDCEANDLPQKNDVRIERTYDPANSNNLMQSEHKLRAAETKSNGPALIDSSTMDSCDFAKALKINAEPVGTKPKPLKRRMDVEQQKRLIKSTILLQNPAKFKMISEMTPANESKPFRDLKTANNSSLIPAKNVTKIIEKAQNVQTAEKKPENIVKLEKIENVIENGVKPQEADNKMITNEAIDEIKVESNAKRKLNIEEYLKRKSLKRHDSNGYKISQNHPEIIQKDSNNDIRNSDKDEIVKINQKIPFENSMYEEIIIVSMGCNTDISIPAASFMKKSDIQNSKSINRTVLLSNIQTTVEKVNSTADCTAIISSTSLISSIQDVILKKTCEETLTENDQNKIKLENNETKNDNDEEEPEHGENKVIMHLPKDRIRPTTVTISIQTESYFQFPPLEKLSSLAKKQMMSAGKRFGSIPKDDVANYVHINNKGKNHKSRKYRSKTALSESSYYSDENQSSSERRSRYSDFYDSNGGERMRSQSHRRSDRHRTISRSLSESSDASNPSTDSSSSSDSSSSGSSVSSANSSSKSFNSYGGSSSRSYYGDDNQFYRIRTKSNNSRRNRSRPQSNRSKSPGTFPIIITIQ